MPVDFKNKLFQKALWGYVPEEVDEYIAYVAGEYTRLEKRLNAIRAENAKIAAEKAASRTPDIPGIPAEPKEASDARAEAESILRQARTQADAILESAGREAASIREEAGAESARILGEAKEAAERGREGLDVIREETEEERKALDALRRELDEKQAGLDALNKELETRKAEQEEQLCRIGEERQALEAQRQACEAQRQECDARRRALDEERTSLDGERIALRAEKDALSAGRTDAEALREAAAEQFRESERIYAGLCAAAERFRNDVLAFSSSMRSMAQSQLSAAERFGTDADRFLEEVNAFSASRPVCPDSDGEISGPDGAGDLFGFASAAAMIGDMLKELPEEQGEIPEEREEPEESEKREEPENPEKPEPENPEPENPEPEPVLFEAETDALFAESAVSDEIAAEADRILDSIRGLTEEEPLSGIEADDLPNDAEGSVELDLPGETAENPDESAEPEETAEPEHVTPEPEPEPEPSDAPNRPESEVPDGDTSDEAAELPQDPGSEPEVPGDEELEAVMKALSGISEDDSYDAILEAFQPGEEVDLNLAADLERKRRENFRRMMDEAAAERDAEKHGGKREKSKNRAAEASSRLPNQESSAESEKDLPDTGETDLEKEIAAAVEAAVRAKLDPEQALDEVFAELSREDGDEEGSLGAAETLFSKAPSELPPDMLELLDFDEPGGDSAAYTDHSLAEFAAGRASEHAVKKTKPRKEPEDGED